MLVHPHFSRDQLFLSSLRFQSQDITGVSVQGRFADVVKNIVIRADGVAGFAVLRGRFDFTIQNAAYQLLPPVAARGLLYPVAFGGGWLEINFCHHFGIGFRIPRPNDQIS